MHFCPTPQYTLWLGNVVLLVRKTPQYTAEFALIKLGKETGTEALIIHVWLTFDPAALRLHVASFPLSFVF